MGYEPLPGQHGGRRDPRKIGDALDDVLRHLGSPSSETLTTVFSRWPEVVGEQIAAHTEPVAVRNGTLAISADDPAWASELQWQGARICERARSVLNDDSIQRITVRVRPTGAGGRPEGGSADTS